MSVALSKPAACRHLMSIEMNRYFQISIKSLLILTALAGIGALGLSVLLRPKPERAVIRVGVFPIPISNGPLVRVYYVASPGGFSRSYHDYPPYGSLDVVRVQGPGYDRAFYSDVRSRQFIGTPPPVITPEVNKEYDNVIVYLSHHCPDLEKLYGDIERSGKPEVFWLKPEELQSMLEFDVPKK